MPFTPLERNSPYMCITTISPTPLVASQYLSHHENVSMIVMQADQVLPTKNRPLIHFHMHTTPVPYPTLTIRVYEHSSKIAVTSNAKNKPNPYSMQRACKGEQQINYDSRSQPCATLEVIEHCAVPTTLKVRP
jgi:hypothetical protein